MLILRRCALFLALAGVVPAVALASGFGGPRGGRLSARAVQAADDHDHLR